MGITEMGIWDTIKSQANVVYKHTLQNVKVGDIFELQKIVSLIFNTCKSAKGNNTCLGDCVHCEQLHKVINEKLKKD